MATSDQSESWVRTVFIVMIRFSHVFSDDECERLIAALPQMHINIANPVRGQCMAAFLGNLWPLGGNVKDRKVASEYRDIKPGTIGLHARTLTTVLPPP